MTGQDGVEAVRRGARARAAHRKWPSGAGVKWLLPQRALRRYGRIMEADGSPVFATPTAATTADAAVTNGKEGRGSVRFP